MNKIIKPLIASAILIASSNVVYADSYSAEKLKEILTSQDDDCNEKVSFQEFFEETVTDNNDSYDVNKDGYITAGEVALEMKEDLVDTVNELNKHGVSEEAATKTITKELNSIAKESALIIKKMDSDGDNLVEPEELKAYQRKQFNKLDANNDGVITAADINKKQAKKGFGYLYNQN
ncbi:MAG: hypothetical protein GQ569_11305 [Methylococcaceae bacterium]|nr:hypothetical protein [Methylococcaceae bacterium]